MKKILLVTMALLASQSIVAGDAWIVKDWTDNWTVNVRKNKDKYVGAVTQPLKVSSGADYIISMNKRTSGAGCRSGDCSAEGATTKRIDKGVYVISVPVNTGNASIDASGNSHIDYSFTVNRLSDSDAKSKYPSLKY